MQRNTECRRLLVVRHGRLDGLRAGDDLDLVPRCEEVVERALLEVVSGEPGDE